MRQERGFSLVELIVAMTVTLIVSSAIYGLLTTGGNAFRREPEVADRQQNIRAAMDLITRDVYGAGAGLPSFSQVFTRNDPGGGACGAGLNGCGPMGTMGAAAAAARASGAGDPSQNSDVLELVSTDEQCPLLWVCSTQPGTGDTTVGSAGLFATAERLPRCLNVPGLVVLAWDDGFTVAAATGAGGATACNAGAAPPNGNLTLTANLAPWVPYGGFGLIPHPGQGSNNAVYLYRGRIVRYRIGPDPTDQVPSLWRSESGRYTAGGAAQPEPGLGAAGPEWQLVARGIEDMQLEYLDGNGAWLNQPPVSVANTWTTLVRQVRVTLSARANAANLQGATAALGGGGPDAVRGELRAVATPRPAFQELQNCLAAAPTPCTPAEHIE